MTNERIYQKIYDQIKGFLPANWTRVIVYLEYGIDSYSVSFYVRIGDRFIKCYDLPGIDEEELINAFRQIDKTVLGEREKTNGDPWSNMTMIIEKDGRMHADYDYTDLQSDAYNYSKAWKLKYIK